MSIPLSGWQKTTIVAASEETGLRIPNMFVAALEAMECVILQDLFLNETARYAHMFLPRSSFLEKDGHPSESMQEIARLTPTFASVTYDKLD